ncbi:MAG: T9SS type A sorting domain-containing protein [Flavobacteriales bacterium]|nr:T9SS type A sorting domain-containing protein [Flavobacteriales bacterium]
MIIGTFERSDEVNGVSTNQQTTYGVAYYYMDDIAVRQLELPNGLPELTVWYVGAGLLGLHWDVARSVDRLRLFEVSGRLLMESMPQHVMGTGTLPIPGSFADGVYLVEVWSGNTRWIKRFVKEEGVY